MQKLEKWGYARDITIGGQKFVSGRAVQASNRSPFSYSSSVSSWT